MNIPQELRYTDDHEWVRIESEGATVVVGITDHAQDQLGDIVFLDLPASGTSVEVGKELGSVESVKAVSDIYAPVSGEILEANAALAEQPELVNQDPYGEGWLVKLRVGEASDLEKLMDAEAYRKHVASMEA
jgi:glycine cleavage system H protein